MKTVQASLAVSIVGAFGQYVLAVEQNLATLHQTFSIIL